MNHRIKIVNWQGQGYFVEVWSEDWRTAVTLPHPDLKCPEELYKTKTEAKAAGEIYLFNENYSKVH